MTRALRIAVLAALAAIVLSGAAAAQQPGKPATGAAPRAPSNAATAPPAAQPNAELPPLDELTAARERPLFSSTRRPPDVEPAPQAAAPITEAASMPFELVGIALGPEVSAAIFRNTESKEEKRVGKGEKIGTWNVEEISERAVVLRGNDKRVRMRLFNEAAGPGIKVGRIGGDGGEESGEANSGDDEQVDEDISPSSSPQVRPATAQPKPPPSLQNNRQRPRRPIRGIPRVRQQP